MSVLLLALIFMSCSALAEDFPPPGTTFYPMQVSVGCTIYNESGEGIPWYMDDGAGSCNMSHSAVGVNGEGYRYIDLNTGPFLANGTWHRVEGTYYGPATVSASACPGTMTSLDWPEGDFPAESFFDVYVTINTPIGTFQTIEPVHLTGLANEWTWHYADGGGVPLAGGGPYDMLDCLSLYWDQSLVPEPSSLLALGAGLVPFGLAIRRKLTR